MKQQHTTQHATTEEQSQRAEMPVITPVPEIVQSVPNQLEKFLHFMSVMDLEMVQVVLDEGNEYRSNADKEELEVTLKKAFAEFRKKGDEYLRVEPGKCINKRCRFGSGGYSFVGNKSDAHLDLITKGSSTHVEEVFLCRSFRFRRGRKPKGEALIVYGSIF